jgi:hypothetical protein
MSKAKQNPTTVSARRRFLRLAASTAAATALLSAPALATTDPDKRFLAMIGRARTLVDRYIAAQTRAHQTYEAASADPEMPEYPQAFLAAMRERGSLMSDAAIEKMHGRCQRDPEARSGQRTLSARRSRSCGSAIRLPHSSPVALRRVDRTCVW